MGGPLQLALVGLNLLLLGRFVVPLAPLFAYLGAGYLLLLHAHHTRSQAASGSWSQAGLLGCWAATWLVFRRGPDSGPVGELLERLPMLGLTEAMNLVGASYIFLKVHDLLRRVQAGAPVPPIRAYLLQMTFLPSFVAGPIAGPETFACGLQLGAAGLAAGANRALVGLLKLYVLAPLIEPWNLLALPAPAAVAGALAWGDVYLGVVTGSLALFLNFSGYTDLAISAGLAMGIRLPENFDAPYLAPSPSEFWQRWHMSFTTWLREHVFSPISRWLVGRGLGGSSAALVVPTTATMLACGLWHRVDLVFLVWGLYHALVVVGHQLWATRARPRLARAGWGPLFASRGYRALAVLVTFHLVTIGWVLMLPLGTPLTEKLALLGRLLHP